MIKFFQNRYVMSEDGAKNLFSAIIWSTVMNISFMLPLILSFMFFGKYLDIMLNGSKVVETEWFLYLGLSVVFFVIMYFVASHQYNSTYTKIYDESAKRRISLAESLRKLPLSFFAKRDVSDLSATIMDDATQTETLFSHTIPQLYAACVTIVIIGICMFIYDWRLAAALFWVIPAAVLLFMLSRKFQNKIHIAGYNTKREIYDKVQEGLESAQEIKAYNCEEKYSEDLGNILDRFEKELIKAELAIGAVVNVSYILLRLGLPTVLFCGANLLLNGKLDIFTYIVFLIIGGKIYEPVMEALSNFALLLFLRVRIERMREMDELPVQSGRMEFSPKNFDLEFKDVDFSYEKGVETLKQVSFRANQGEVTALVGPSGGGKTTIAKLAARFWDIDGGSILLGGEDISLIDPEMLLKNFSIVFQDVTLFNTSVMENIRIGKRDASDEEVMNAAKLAQCDEFVNNLTEGYDTLIGENGEKLSGGERQRISIARAILKDAPIILLDEATASLDTENETKIQSALSELIKNKTVIIIAHRMRTVMNADKIIVISDGSIREMASPDELMAKGGMFADMVKAQMS